MKYCCLILLVLTLFVKTEEVFAQNGFDSTYDFCTDTAIQSAIFSCYADSNRVFIEGNTQTAAVSALHGFLAGVDYSGQVQWAKKLLFPGEFNTSWSYKGIIKIDSDKYVYIGTILDYDISPTATLFHPFFYTFNGNGDSIRYSVYIDSFRQRYFSSVLSDGKYLITAGTIFYPNSASIWLCKYDTVGNKIWQKEYLASINTPENTAIVLSSDKQHYLVAGSMYDSTVHSWTTGFMKIDTAGNIVYLKSLKRPLIAYNDADVVTNPTGGYYFVSSYSYSPKWAPDSSNVYYGKLNENGDTLWTKTFDGDFKNTKGLQIAWSNDKRYLILLIGPFSATRTGILKIDTLGNIIWTRVPLHVFPVNGFNNGGVIHSLSITPDERYLMGGYTVDFGVYSWVILTDSSGCRYPNDPACLPFSLSTYSTNNQLVSCYPNPMNDQLNIAGAPVGTAIQVNNIIGQVVYKGVIHSSKEIINTSQWAYGSYILYLIDKDGSRVARKVVKQ